MRVVAQTKQAACSIVEIGLWMVALSLDGWLEADVWSNRSPRVDVACGDLDQSGSVFDSCARTLRRSLLSLTAVEHTSELCTALFSLGGDCKAVPKADSTISALATGQQNILIVYPVRPANTFKKVSSAKRT